MQIDKFAGAAMALVLVATLGACAKKSEEAKTMVESTTATATSAVAVDTAAIAEAVKADAAGLVAAFNARDAEKAVSYDAPDYVGMLHGMPNVVGPAADLVATKLQVADPALKLVLSNETVDVAASGDLAVYRANFAYTYTDPKTKAPTTELGNWLLGFKTQPDGTRKLAWSVVSDTPAP